ncbi:MAG: sulfite oxidase [Nisaea sp.]|uniref:sulfite oxidase n=1 Tax=Nisaea sp. TaxID=2024842 RepID=UPI003263380A
MAYDETKVPAEEFQHFKGAGPRCNETHLSAAPGRRSFLTQVGLAGLGALAGSALPFQYDASGDFIARALADEDPLFGKSGLTLLNDRPLNAETPPELLDDAITPTERHFIRNNGLPPEDPNSDAWVLAVDGLVEQPMNLRIQDLREQFEVVTKALVIECAGNGRRSFEPPTRGNQWSFGAVGCSQWTGVRLKDVLDKAGVHPDAIYTAHYGADGHLSGDPSRSPISRGLPIWKAMTENVLIAFEMNGAPLHPMNGAPLRLVVPGWPASTSHKWLTRIQLRDRVHDGAKMTGKSYRVPAYPVSPGAKVADQDMVIIERMPVKSLITFPAKDAKVALSSGVRGHAWSGDREISKVEISTDFGASWIAAELDPAVNRGAWQNWRATLELAQPRYYEIWARATDSAGDVQPFGIDWNPKGYLNNSLHRVGVHAS